jgi:hypothetical protein
MDVMNLMCSGSPTDVTGSPVAADNEILATADSFPQRTFLGFAMAASDANPLQKKRRSFFGFGTAGDHSCQ